MSSLATEARLFQSDEHFSQSPPTAQYEIAASHGGKCTQNFLEALIYIEQMHEDAGAQKDN